MRFDGLIANEYLSDLVVYDDEYKTDADKYHNIGTEFENIVTEYISTMKRIGTNLEGKFADNVNDYVSIVEMLLNDVVKETYYEQERKMKSYVKEIDDADDKVY